MKDSELLREYGRTGAGEAFAEIVSRHIDLVYSAAVRQVRDGHLAEDVTQAVFVLLARKAGKVAGVNVAGWLYSTTRYAARNAMKIEARRRRREREAGQAMGASSEEVGWEELAGELDEAVAGLGKGEREVVLLHYFQGRKLGEVGAELGISEAAAKKRASRAIEKMRGFFAGRGYEVSAGALGAMVVEHGVEAAPGDLAGVVVKAIGGPGEAVGAIVKGVEGMHAMAQLKLVAAVVVGLCLAGGVLIFAGEGVRPQAKAGPATAPAGLGGLNTLYVRTVFTNRAYPVFEDFYDRTEGIIRCLNYRHGTYVIINDGQYEWRRKLGAPLVSRRKNITSLAQWLTNDTPTLGGYAKQNPVRDPSGDRSIGNDPCQCYRLTGLPEEYRPTSIWVDNRNRVHRFQRELKGNNAWNSIEIDYTYDAPIDPARFAATQPADAEVVDAERYLEKVFPLDNVIYMTESRGMVFAIHYLEQDAGGRFHLICSTRPTEARRTKMKPTYEGPIRGDFLIRGGTSLTSSSYKGEKTAELVGDGLATVGYYVLIPEFDRQIIPDLCQFRVLFLTGSNATTLPTVVGADERPGVPDETAAFPVEIEVPRAGNVTLSDFLGRAYDTASRVEGILDARVNGAPPVFISKEDFVRQALDRVEGRNRGDQKK